MGSILWFPHFGKLPFAAKGLLISGQRSSIVDVSVFRLWSIYRVTIRLGLGFGSVGFQNFGLGVGGQGLRAKVWGIGASGLRVFKVEGCAH